MKIFIAGLLTIALISCQRHVKVDTKAELISAMNNFLNDNAPKDGNIHFDVKSVTYFEQKNNYLCEFQVKMTNNLNDSTHPKIDTIGTMKARIDKTFSEVVRIY